MASTLNVSGTATLGSSLDVASATRLASTLNVSGATVLGSSLDVAGTANFTNLNISGAVRLASTLNVSGATVLGSSLDVAGPTRLATTLNISGATALSSTLTISSIARSGGITLLYDSGGFATPGFPAASHNQIYFNGPSNVTNATSAILGSDGSGNLVILNGNGGNTNAGLITNTVKCDSLVAGTANMSSTLTVTGQSNLNGGLSVNGGKMSVDATTGDIALNAGNNYGAYMKMNGNTLEVYGANIGSGGTPAYTKLKGISSASFFGVIIDSGATNITGNLQIGSYNINGTSGVFNGSASSATTAGTANALNTANSYTVSTINATGAGYSTINGFQIGAINTGGVATGILGPAGVVFQIAGGTGGGGPGGRQLIQMYDSVNIAGDLTVGSSATPKTFTLNGVACPLLWRYYATNGMNNGLNPGPGGTDGQGSFAVFSTDSYPGTYNVSWAGGVWSSPLTGVYQININLAASADQDYGGLSLVCGSRGIYDFCLITRSSIGQSINTVVRLTAGNTVVLSATNNYVRTFTGSVGNVWIQDAKICITMISSQ